MNTLMHICCAPCANRPIAVLREKGIQVAIASGRSWASIEKAFEPVKHKIFYISNNGAYLGCCGSLDENVGRLVDYLKKACLYENTIIFYTSDHGSHFRTRNQEYKRSCHDSSIHIPLLAKGGCFDGGHVVDELVSVVDYAPTLLNAAGIEAAGMKGRPIQELLKPGAEPIREEVFIQISESCVGRALRTRDYTYAVQAEEGFDEIVVGVDDGVVDFGTGRTVPGGMNEE